MELWRFFCVCFSTVVIKRFGNDDINVDNKHTMYYNSLRMQFYNWNNEKNEKLKKERAISFEEVVFYIETDNLLVR